MIEALTLLAAFCGMGFALYQMRCVALAADATTAKAVQALAQVKGLTPHQAAPERIAPSSVPYEELHRVETTRVDSLAASAKARMRRLILDARDGFAKQGNEGKVAEMDERLKRLDEERVA